MTKTTAVEGRGRSGLRSNESYPVGPVKSDEDDFHRLRELLALLVLCVLKHWTLRDRIIKRNGPVKGRRGASSSTFIDVVVLATFQFRSRADETVAKYRSLGLYRRDGRKSVKLHKKNAADENYRLL